MGVRRGDWAPRVPGASAPPGPAPSRGRAATPAQLLRPFASLLGGMVVAIVALVAGAAADRALVLGASMTLLGFATGAMRGVHGLRRGDSRPAGAPARLQRPRSGSAAPGDAPVSASLDAPAGSPDTPAASLVAPAALGVCGIGGLLLALSAGLPAALLAALVLAVGLWSARVAEGTRLSWLPTALTVPLLPVFGWLGATGTVPASFAVMVPVAALGGAALAISGAVADVETDLASGAASIAIALGATGAAAVALALQLLVAAVALASLRLMGAAGDWPELAVAASLTPVAGAILGVLVAGRGRGSREVAFEVQAVGLAVLAVAWVNTMGGVGPA